MKKARTIDRIRKAFPGLTWRYEWPSKYISSAGWEIQAFAGLSMCCMDPCDHYNTEWRRSDTGERVYFFHDDIFSAF
jgi:hypothetical protein